MRIRRASTGSPFGQLIYLKRTEVDEICEGALKESKLLPEQPAPIDIEKFIEQFINAKLDFGTDLGQDVLGFTFFSPSGKPELVGISPNLDQGGLVSDRRIRATLAHEAGHCLIHPILFINEASNQRNFLDENIDFSRKRILCRKGDINPKGKYDGRWWELQANFAIGGFLLPRTLVTRSIEDFLEPSGLLGGTVIRDRMAAVEHVAKIFDVNPVVGRIRLDHLFPESDQLEL